jgi:protein-L-isoaspartate(D-aspartate) O-methyltransferase
MKALILLFSFLLVTCGPGGDRTKPASGAAHGDPFEAKRRELVDSFATGSRAQVTDARVIKAMRDTPRHRFVPDALQSLAYVDRPLPIGHGQTISQPSLVAFMTEQLRPQPADRVLEIGTGSGYQAAVLSPLVAEVFTIEIVEPLAKRAAKTLSDLGFANVHTRAGNGYLGWPEAAPFDAIIVTCAPDAIPPALIAQLREGGRMIIPVGPENQVQELYLLEKRADKIEQRAILPVRFVPMTGSPGSAP